MTSVQNSYWQILISGAQEGFCPKIPCDRECADVPGLDFRQRLASNIEDLAGGRIRERVMKGSDHLTSYRKKARWLRTAMARLERLVPERDRVREIMIRSACPYPRDRIRELRTVYLKTRNIDRVLDEMNKDPFYAFPARHDNIVYMTKLPRDKKTYGRALMPKSKRLAYCHCDYARAVAGRISSEFCYCGSGWFCQLWSGILGVPVRVVMIKSVLRGDGCCTFAIDVGPLPPSRERNMRGR
jgi:hypothetical protein